jgi:hypothetical protein
MSDEEAEWFSARSAGPAITVIRSAPNADALSFTTAAVPMAQLAGAAKPAAIVSRSLAALAPAARANGTPDAARDRRSSASGRRARRRSDFCRRALWQRHRGERMAGWCGTFRAVTETRMASMLWRAFARLLRDKEDVIGLDVIG